MSHCSHSEPLNKPASANDDHIRFYRLPPTSADRGFLQRIFRLRYEVYCLERQFLDARGFPDGLETDEFDATSTHVAAYSSNHDIVGSLRLVQPAAPQIFPFEHTCALFHNATLPPREESGEISRFVVRKSHRQNKPNFLTETQPAPLFDETSAFQPKATTTAAELVMGMYRELYRYSCATGVRYWYAAMERSLALLLRRTGFKFEPIGPVTDYYGPVIPFVVDLNVLKITLEAQNPVLWDWFNHASADAQHPDDPFCPDLHFSSVGTFDSVVSPAQP